MGGDSVLSGFDVSRWQLGAYAGGGGFAFGIAKATEGVGFMDPAFPRHMAAIRAEQARRPEFVAGAYDYCRYDLGNSPEAEADWLLQVVGDPRGLLLAPDIEVPGYNGPLADWRARFIAHLAARTSGYQAPWYSFRNYIATHALNTAQTTWCWLAWPDSNGPLPSLLVPIRMQQYGLTTVPGIAGQVDANRFFGTAAELRALTVGGVAPARRLPSGGGEGTVELLEGHDGRRHRLLVADGGALEDGTRGGPVHWVALAGGTGALDAWPGGDGELPGGGGWIVAGTLAAFLEVYQDHERLTVEGVGRDGALYQKTCSAGPDGYAELEGWHPVNAPKVALPGSSGMPGPVGPAGPAVTDDHIAEVAVKTVIAEIERRLENG